MNSNNVLWATLLGVIFFFVADNIAGQMGIIFPTFWGKMLFFSIPFAGGAICSRLL